MSTQWICFIIVKAKGGVNRSHLIDKSSFFIGRSQEVDLAVAHTGISRQHLKVEVTADGVQLTDQTSANGTFINETRLTPQVATPIPPNSKIRLGQIDEEWMFMSVPRPSEIDDIDAQRQALTTKLEATRRELEEGIKFQAEKIRLNAQLEADKLLARSTLEVERNKTEGLMQLQLQKTAIEHEIGELQEKRHQAASRAEFEAQREADRMVAEAQKRIQEDYEKAHIEIEKRYRESQAKSFEKISAAESQAQKLVSEAQQDAQATRTQSLEEARMLQQESLRKSSDLTTVMQENFQKEIEEKKKQILDSTSREAKEERDRLLASYTHDLGPLRDAVEKIKSERDAEQILFDRVKSEADLVKTELQEARKGLEDAELLRKSVTDLEIRREKAQMQFESYEDKRQQGERLLETEMADVKRKATVLYEELKRRQEDELGKAKLKALDDVKARIDQEEKRYVEIRRLRSLEISERVSEKLLSTLKEGVPAPGTLKSLIETAVSEANGSTLLEANRVVTSEPSAGDKPKASPTKKWAIAASIAVLATTGVFRQQVWGFIRTHQGEGIARNIIAQRQIQSIYQPQQDNSFRASYTDNVLYMRNYYETKTNADYIERWTLRLNDLELARSMGLTEEDLIRYAAKEANLIVRLGELRGHIDAVYLDDGIKKMRDAESEDLVAMKSLLKTPANYKKMSDMEIKFLREFQASQGIR